MELNHAVAKKNPSPSPLHEVLHGSASAEDAAMYTEADGWSKVEEVHHAPAALRFLNVGTTPDGGVQVLWVEEGLMHFSTRVADGWMEPRPLFRGIQPQMVIDAQGDAHVVFVHDYGGRVQIYYTRHSDPVWTLPYEISRTRGLSQQPRVAVAPDGLVYAVWEDDTPGFASIYHAYNPEGYWINAPVPGVRGWRPSLAFDGTGTLHLVWESAIPNGEGDDIFHTQLGPGGWSLPENISDSPLTDSALPRVVGSPNDTVHVVWQERRQDRSAIGYSSGRYASWLKPLALTKGGRQQLPDLAIAAEGDLHVIWQDGDVLAYRHRNPGADAIWQTPQVLDRQSSSLEDFALTCDSQGGVHVLWSRRTKERWTLYYRHRQGERPHKQFIPDVVG